MKPIAAAQQVILDMHDRVDRIDFALTRKRDLEKAIMDLQALQRRADVAIELLKIKGQPNRKS